MDHCATGDLKNKNGAVWYVCAGHNEGDELVAVVDAPREYICASGELDREGARWLAAGLEALRELKVDLR
jgi:hypothetical protein